MRRRRNRATAARSSHLGVDRPDIQFAIPEGKGRPVCLGRAEGHHHDRGQDRQGTCNEHVCRFRPGGPKSEEHERRRADSRRNGSQDMELDPELHRD